MNSISLISAPARNAMATPSPVAIDGLVVEEYRKPTPPVAKIIAFAGKVRTIPDGDKHHRPTTPFFGLPYSLCIKSIAIQFSYILKFLSISLEADLESALSISAPVASFECKILLLECPPSLALSYSPS